MTYEQRQSLAAKVCSMQRELSRLIEHLYECEVPFDDELARLTVSALDDMQRLQLYVRAIDLGLFPIADDAA